MSHDRCRVSPFPCSSSNRMQQLPKLSSETEETLKEWEDVRCAVCMEHPHNAVLLMCSSYEKGCRPYMCDTSYRHSNCLDQFCKSFAAKTLSTMTQHELQHTTTNLSPAEASESTVEVQQEISEGGTAISCEKQIPPKLLCPLCRGQIKEWIIVEAARLFMNAKPRSCSCETCNFSGTYTDLRKHARLEHPLVRPSDADPERQRSWRRLERQRDLGDLLSTLQSSMGDDRDESILPIDDGGWLTVFFLIRVYRPGSSSRGNSWLGGSRTRAQLRIRRRPGRLLGENYEEETGSSSRDEDNESSDDESGNWTPLERHERIQRRTTPDNLP